MHIDPQTGQMVSDENDGPDLSSFAAPPDLGGGGGEDYSPDPSVLSQILGSSNPEERAAGASGLNYTPGQQDPQFHPFIQNLMDANAVQPQVDKMSAMRTLLEQQFPKTPDAVRQKTPALAYILGGLQDAMALGSMLRRPTKRQYYTGRHGRGGKPVMATYYEQPQHIPAPVGGTAAALFGPMIRQQQDQRVVDRQNFMRNSQIAAELSRYAGSAAMRPSAAAPRPSAFMQGFTTLTELERNGQVPAGTRDKYVTHFVGGDKQGAKQTLEEQAAALDAAGNHDAAEKMRAAHKAWTAAGRNPTISPDDKTAQQLAVFKGKIKILTDSGLISPDRGRTVTAIAKPYDEQIAALVKQKELFLKQADAEGMMGDRALTLNHANVAQRKIDELREKKRVAVQGYLSSSGLDINRPEVANLLQDEPDAGLPDGGGTTFGGGPRDIRAMLPAGVDPSQIVLSNGMTAADFTPERLSAMSEQELLDLQDEITQAYGSGQ